MQAEGTVVKVLRQPDDPPLRVVATRGSEDDA
jgi:hypothetical protein